MSKLPQSFRKVVCHTLGNDFRKVTKVETVPMIHPGATEVLVRNRFVGINASDINFTSGRYFSDAKPPFDTGFEGVGEIVEVGKDSQFKVGQAVLYQDYGAFTEFKTLTADKVIPIPKADPGFLPLLVSGLTASIALDDKGHLKPNETVLVTAAAGGTGQFAVQWAKQAGCKVIGTCSSDEKAAFLKKIGCDRPVNYKKEKLGDVLKKEYPKGVDVVYESIGGEMFETCLANLSIKGRLIVIGAISKYESGAVKADSIESMLELPMNLLRKSANISGFFLPHYPTAMKEFLTKLIGLYSSGKLHSGFDCGPAGGKFDSVDKIADAIDYMYAGKNTGKLVVEVGPDATRL